MIYLKKTGIRLSAFQRMIAWMYRRYVFVPVIEQLENYETESEEEEAYREKKILDWLPSEEGIHRTDH